MNNFKFETLILFIFCITTATFSLSSFIKKFDKLNYQIDHQRYRRSASEGLFKTPLKIFFQAFTKNFHLNLYEDDSVFYPKTQILVNNRVHYLNDFVPVKGHLRNDYSSQIYGTIVDGVFRGFIKSDKTNHSSGVYYIEHSSYYFKKDPGFHSIIYHDSHLHDNYTSNYIDLKSPSYCGWSNSNVSHIMHLSSVQHNRYKRDDFIERLQSKRKKRSIANKSNQYVCNLYLQSDTFLWDKIMSLHHIKGQKYLAIKEISSIFAQHVQGAQAIYQNTNFQKFNGDDKYNGIGFRVDRVRINTTDDCESGTNRDNNPFCSANIDVTNFLNLNSYVKHDDFCLAYIFTYRDFNGGTLGLAWVAEPGGSGGVCEKHRMMQEGTQNVKKSLNTGIVTLLNYGSYVALKVSQLTFAHEMGHNFGSKHDDDHKDHQDCLPSVDDPKGNYIMFASATSGDKENNNKFSTCSRDSIARLLNRVTKGNGNCFLHQEGSFCGNKLAEEDEQCDCGYSSEDCKDKCCNPKLSNASCKLKQKVEIEGSFKQVLCSPSAGECCTKDCQFQPNQHLCRTKGECHKAAYCNGNHTKCPPSEKVPDLTKCQDNTRVCKNGQCVGSICESVPGWQECSIIRSEKVTPEMMCFVACKENKTHSPCISTFELELKSELREKYPHLAKQLLLNNKPIQLKAGGPCDNYHGYCDAFLRCRSVEADGPLARIKNLIFSSAMLKKVERWIMQFWWGVMLICIGGIIFVGIFLKLFSRSTPSTNPKHRKRPVPNPVNHRRVDRSNEPRSRIEVQPNGIVRPSAPPPRPDRQQLPVRKHNVIPDSNRIHRNRDRPISMYQSSANHSDASTRPLSMNFDSNITELHEVSNIIASHNKPSYPPPAYAEVSPIVMPRQHGHGRGKKGHRHALNQQASRYN